MSIPTPENSPKSASDTKLYSVPRRYDLATLFTVSFAYALLFGSMRLFSASPAVASYVGLLVTMVGLAQALFMKGKMPRLASVLAGFLWGLTIALIYLVQHRSSPSLVATFVAAFFWGLIVGYPAGLLVAGVFLVADLVRKAIRWLRKRFGAGGDSGNEAEDESPFGKQ